MTQDSERKPQPWHAADEKPARGAPKGGPIGTHSFTGGGLSVGMPASPTDSEPQRGDASAEDAAEPPLLDEPRAGRGDLLGRK